MDWFKGCVDVAAVKRLYRKLAKEHHPDVSGYDSTSVMQKINDAYHTVLEGMHGQTSKGSDGKDHTYYYNAAREDELIEMVQAAVGLNLPDVTVEIIGSWLWVHGDTKPHRAKLGRKDKGGIGLRWHGKRSMWYWKPKSTYRRRYSGMHFDDMRAMYGSKVMADGAQDEQSGKVWAK